MLHTSMCTQGFRAGEQTNFYGVCKMPAQKQKAQMILLKG